jgi:eukaryotic-like serine/threonine-protein kinase
MRLSRGFRLGVYEIVSELGAGGMGEVYRATDTSLGRDVAIKVLSESMALDSERLARFDREAKTLALLNHPNIAAIYGLERTAGGTALVMELVDGQTLAEEIARGPLPLEQTLAIARQIAGALEAAHDQGIIHRDLKPANIKLRRDGRVKVLDFGLAKAIEPGPASTTVRPDGGDRTYAPTITSPALITGAGMLLGTAAYMAPEQAKGRPVDTRADIWAFGVIVYEMVTGKSPFAAETVVETLAAILNRVPDLSQVPPQLRPMLQATLEPDPRQRLRAIGDAFRLLDMSVVTGPAEAGRYVSRSRRSIAILVALAAVAIVATVLALIGWIRQPGITADTRRLQIVLPPKAQPDFAMSLSPDGRRLAFVVVGDDGSRAAWVRTLDTLDAQPVRGTENLATNPVFWSSDSRWLGFSVPGEIRRVNVVEGGDPVAIARGSQIGADSNAEGMLVFGTNPGAVGGGAVFRVPATGGEPVPVTKIDPSRGEYAHHHPTFLPDGRHFLYLRAARPESRSGIYVGSIDVSPDQQSTERLIATTYGPAFYVPPAAGDAGLLFYLRNNTLMAQRFDPGRLALSGEPTAVASPVGAFIDRALFSVSDDGTIVYTSSANVLTRQLTWVDATGQVLSRVGAPAVFSDVALAPNGTSAAGTILDLDSPSGRNELWLWDLARGTQSLLSAKSQQASSPAWSFDNTRLAFAVTTENGPEMYERSISGLEEARLLLRSTDGGSVTPTSWSPDGRFILVTRLNAETGADIWALSRDTGMATPLIRTTAVERDAQFSPDGRWIAYRASDAEDGQPDVYVTAVQATSPSLRVAGGPWRVSSGRGAFPRWRADSREIYYAGQSSMIAVPVFTDAGFTVGTPRPLPGYAASAGVLAGRYGFVDASPDGKRFLYARPVDGTVTTRPPVNVVLNWRPPMK